jgi:hypothetical protein
MGGRYYDATKRARTFDMESSLLLHRNKVEAHSNETTATAHFKPIQPQFDALQQASASRDQMSLIFVFSIACVKQSEDDGRYYEEERRGYGWW